MKVILIKDVARIGRKSEVKDVPSGHALNFLIPRRLAIPATPENLKRVNEMHKKSATDKEVSASAFKEAVEKLASHKVVYEADANEKGHLFKGINASDIAAKLRSEGYDLTESDVRLEHPLKAVGVHQVPLMRDGAEGECSLEIVKK